MAKRKKSMEAPTQAEEQKEVLLSNKEKEPEKAGSLGLKLVDSTELLSDGASSLGASSDNLVESEDGVSLEDAVSPVVEEEGRAFRYSARSIFLTYPKCTLRKEELGLLIKEKFLSKKLELSYLGVAEEKHKDGSSHLHAMALTTGKRIEARLSSFMDFQGFHPNVSVIKNLYGAYQYLRKDDKEPFEEGSFKKQKVGAASNYDLMVYRLAKYGLNRKTLAAFPSTLFYLYRLVQALKIAAQLPDRGDSTDDDPFKDPTAMGLDVDRLDRLIHAATGIELVKNDEFRVKDD